MDIKVNREELIKAVNITRRALSKIIIQQERGHLLLTVSDGKLRVTGTNNDIKAHYVMDAMCSGDVRFAFTCDPKILSGVLSKIDLSDIIIDYDENDQSVKVFTGASSTSFAKLQSFPSKMMLTFEPNPSRSVCAVQRKSLVAALKYAMRYLAPLKDDCRNFDIVSISKGVLYAANGNNMMGFMVSNAFKDLEDVRLRKAIIPFLATTLDSLEDDMVGIIQTPSDTGIETQTVYFSALKPSMDPPSVPIQRVKSEGPYTSIDRLLLLKHLDRLVASHTGMPDSIAVTATLGGAGDSSYIDLSLMSSKSTERVPCVRVNDDNLADVTHSLDYKVLKAVLNSFDNVKTMRLHINQEGVKMFKAYEKGEIDKESFVQVGIGGYVKATSQN